MVDQLGVGSSKLSSTAIFSRRGADDLRFRQWLRTLARMCTATDQKAMVNHWFCIPYQKLHEMTKDNSSYSADSSVSPRECQHFSATGEGDSVGVRPAVMTMLRCLTLA